MRRWLRKWRGVQGWCLSAEPTSGLVRKQVRKREKEKERKHAPAPHRVDCNTAASVQDATEARYTDAVGFRRLVQFGLFPRAALAMRTKLEPIEGFTSPIELKVSACMQL